MYTKSKLSEWAIDFGLCQATLLSNNATSQSARSIIQVGRNFDEGTINYDCLNKRIIRKD